MQANSRTALWILAAVWLTGCATGERVLMPTPHVYSEAKEELFSEVPPALRSSSVPVFYVTDRAPESGEDGRFGYGAGRSASLAYGEATVEIGESLAWEQVVEVSTARERAEPVHVRLREVREIGRTPPTPFPFTARGGFFDYDPVVMRTVRGVGDTFRAELAKRLALTPRKELFVFVHGFNNTFEEAALTLAEMWHFFGREGVPVLYSWPAGAGGLIGYAVDRESGEFTIFHLKAMLEVLADHPDVERIHILAHSRGTDVTTAAVRELFSVSRAAGVDPAKRFKIANLIMAAPDLDVDVVQQRLMTEPIAPGIGKITLYVSKTDEALGLAEFLFSSVVRLGRIGVGTIEKATGNAMVNVTNVDVVELQGSGGEFGHSYFHSNPAVSADIYLTTRFARAPGAENGRPLERQGERFYLIRDDYLRGP